MTLGFVIDVLLCWTTKPKWHLANNVQGATLGAFTTARASRHPYPESCQYRYPALIVEDKSWTIRLTYQGISREEIAGKQVNTGIR